MLSGLKARLGSQLALGMRIAVAGLALAAGQATLAQAQDDIVIAHVYGKTGPYEGYGASLQRGLMLGLQYATDGKMEIDGRKIRVIEKDTQLKPDLAKSLLTEAYSDDNADIAVGDISSGATLAQMPVAQDFGKIFIVDASTADSITGSAFNEYTFRTTRSLTQDAIASALSIPGGKDVYIGTLAQEIALGKEGIAAFKAATAKTGAQVVHEEYAPFATEDLTPYILRLFDALKDKPGQKYIFVNWGGAVGKTLTTIQAMKPERYGIKLTTYTNLFVEMEGYKNIPDLEGSDYYYYTTPKNPINDWLVAEHEKQFGGPPEFTVVNGFIAAQLIVKAIKEAKSTDAEKLIPVMEGMELDTPKGKIQMRAEDHQALQSMWRYKIKNDPNVKWGVPVPVQEFTIKDIDVPIRNKR